VINVTGRDPAPTPGRPARTPESAAVTFTTADYEKVLEEMFAAALAEGECFLDVSARTLHAKVSGANKNDKGMAVCTRLMRRMMIPGDNELSTSFRPNGNAPLIRFRLPR